MYCRIIKVLIDLSVSLVLCILLLPFLLVAVILLSITNRGKVFFLQPRVGKCERIFRVIKFKSMNDRRDKNGQLLPDMDRITTFGRFMRKYSLDELPQLFNVLKGDMSLVGPRPLLIHYLPLYSAEQRKRHNVRPGITGWAQLNGRNAISWTKKFELDIWYVDRISLKLDCKILFMTFIKVVKASDIDQGDRITMEGFNGYN
jgi:undecaprenyl phosphate N,N'-diacetylbacillosamine 1-phosphate transferase